MYYKLNENQEIVPCRNALEWANWLATANRHIGKTQVFEVTVSTVFLGMGHCSNNLEEEGFDFMFETMLFGSQEVLDYISKVNYEDNTSIIAKLFGPVDIQKRYKTIEEARTGHQQMVDFVYSVLVARN